jgi:uncharacterized protein YraI
MKKFKRILCLAICTLMLSTQLVSAATIVEPDYEFAYVVKMVVDVDSGSTLTIRSGPGTSYSKVGSLKDGAIIEVAGSNSARTWYWLGSSTGWVSADYVYIY